ncbi:hypothetical protein GE061_009513 [Apolygus lucorum]|uniref:Uncharacterized protein n=1 Tax=Apolygus lucorum TaxID=248454 RepID=A0A6A4IPP9_APOLU|nr:hypothetical protein GE061_009513 [Apolygus lucorum]
MLLRGGKSTLELVRAVPDRSRRRLLPPPKTRLHWRATTQRQLVPSSDFSAAPSLERVGSAVRIRSKSPFRSRYSVRSERVFICFIFCIIFTVS